MESDRTGEYPIKNEITRVIASTAYQTYEKALLKEVKESDTPNHVAIIMDGNRRFAREIGLSTSEGHIKGKDKLEEVMEWCLELDIHILTVYAFSTENLMRDHEEVVIGRSSGATPPSAGTLGADLSG